MLHKTALPSCKGHPPVHKRSLLTVPTTGRRGGLVWCMHPYQFLQPNLHICYWWHTPHMITPFYTRLAWWHTRMPEKDLVGLC